MGNQPFPGRACKKDCLLLRVNIKRSWVIFPLTLSICFVTLDDGLPFDLK